MKSLLVLIAYFLLLVKLSVHIPRGYAKSLSDADFWNTSAKVLQITLGAEASIVQNVNTSEHIQLACRFNQPSWYKDGVFLAARRELALKFVKLKDAGVYSCFTETTELHGRKWANLTLNVIENPANKIATDIADFRKIEIQLVDKESEEPLEIGDGVVEQLPIDKIPMEKFTLAKTDTKVDTADTQVSVSEFSAPKFKQSYKLVKYLQRTAGTLAQLSCAALGNPLPSIVWSVNNTKLSANQKYKMKKWSLLIEDLTTADDGDYKCILCNGIGCIEHATRLTVFSRLRTIPYISDNTPENQTVAVNANAHFECRVICDVEPHIVWLRHTKVENEPRSIEELETSLDGMRNFLETPNILKLTTSEDEPHMLRLGNVQTDDEGWYTCIAATNLGRTMASAFLRVLETEVTTLPSVEDNWANVSAVVLDFKHMEALKPKLAKQIPKSKSTSSGLELTTAKNSSNEPTETTHETDYDTDSEHNLDKIAEFAPLFKTTHETDNDTGSERNLDKIVEFAPLFKKSDKFQSNLHKPAGSSIQLLCPAIGNPTPNITWTRNNTKEEITRPLGRVTYKKWSMQMDEIVTDDSGAYTCSVCNKLGCIEHTTKLTINDRLRSRPILSDKFPQNQTVLTNRTAQLECRVVSDLEPYIWWIKYSRTNETIRELEKTVPIGLNNVSEQYAKHFIKLQPIDPDKPHVLRLDNVTHDDEGWYTCIAANALGQSMASAYLKVVDKLPSREVYTLLRSHPIWITVVAIVVVLLFLLGSIFMIYVLRKLKHEKLLKHRIETVHQWTKKVIIYKPPTSESNSGSGDLQMPVIKIEKQRTTFQQTSSNTGGDPSQAFNEYEFPLDSNWEIPRGQLALGSTLGEGAFGRVVMAEACGLPRSNSLNSTTIVAVKMVKEEHTDADMASLVREMEVMKMIGKHINIINLLGCCSQSGPLWVIVEFAPHGNLKDFLKKNRPLGSHSLQRQRQSGYLCDDAAANEPRLTEKNLISFAFQIARGMEYLASRRCIHRDLAARNVLVTDDYVMKIADFGLARDIQDTDYYRKNTNGRLPIKWMAPESLQEKFYDSQSDVWSYGVLLWEIMTYGEQPYPHIMSAEELYSYLITGQRMEKPPRCSLNIYMLMRQCWHFDTCARPTFVELVENLDKILQLAANSSANDEYLDLSMPMLETPPSSSDDESETETFQETSPLRYQYTYKFN